MAVRQATCLLTIERLQPQQQHSRLAGPPKHLVTNSKSFAAVNESRQSHAKRTKAGNGKAVGFICEMVVAQAEAQFERCVALKYALADLL